MCDLRASGELHFFAAHDVDWHGCFGDRTLGGAARAGDRHRGQRERRFSERKVCRRGLSINDGDGCVGCRKSDKSYRECDRATGCEQAICAVSACLRTALCAGDENGHALNWACGARFHHAATDAACRLCGARGREGYACCEEC